MMLPQPSSCKSSCTSPLCDICDKIGPTASQSQQDLSVHHLSSSTAQLRVLRLFCVPTRQAHEDLRSAMSRGDGLH